MIRIAIATLCATVALMGLTSSAEADSASLTDQSGLEYDIEWGTDFTNTYITTTTYTSTSTHTTTGGGTTTTTYTTSSGTSVSTTVERTDAIEEASYTTSVTYTTSGGGTAMGTLSDLFDDYSQLQIGSTRFYGEAGTRLLCNGRELDLGMQTIDGIDVSRRIFVPSDDEFVRIVSIFTNNGSADASFTVIIDGDMGSDSETIITASSSGDMMLDTSDIWFASAGDYSDPRAGHVIGGEGASVPAATVTQDSGDPDEFTWTYDLSLSPGETAIIVNYATGQPNIADAATQAAALANLEPAAALECLSEDEIKQVVNFDLGGDGGGGCNCDVPGGTRSASPFAPMGLGIALLGLWIVRRRRLI